ncbi:intercellular adhesion molecule 5-like isoform X2 [Acipenser ruthenus]|uniref:intercellular adhesion molecule 5-like isoform X2 n=1 Tax=Acipenser ruthenus TaxID=7906 RepID=UPI0027412249|nr:intercellular adhesion molecule 5-like isoform X2 [Acipenser ruthenus]
MEVRPLHILSVSLLLVSITTSGAAFAVCDVNIDPSRVVVRFGDPVTVNCSTTREDVLGAGWEASVSPVNEQKSKIAVWNVSSLTVWDAEPKCFINYNNEPRQCAEKLDLVIYNFEEQPILTVSENVEVNQPSTVRCELKNAFPPEEVQVELLINNEIHTNRSNMDNVYVEKSFTLDSVEPAAITCNVSLRSLSKSASRNVQGYVLPEPTLHTEAVLVNHTGIVTCSVDGSFPATATQRLLLNGLIVNKTHNSTPAQYEFKAEKELNGKMITCETELKLAATPVKKNQSTTFNILYPPTIKTHFPASKDLKEGETLSSHFDCEAEGNPPPKTVWLKDSKEFDSSKILTRTDGGVYQLKTMNNYGSAVATVTVTVGYEPSAINPAEESVPVLKGDSVVFNCTADGIPAPTYTWKHPEADNVKITTKDSVSTVTITGASSSNRGVYECHARNIHGNFTRKVTVEVTDYLIPIIAGVVVLIVLVIPILIMVLYYVYYKQHKTGEYNLKGKPSSANGSVAHNGKAADEIPLTQV